MENARGCLGVAAMVFFFATVLIGWVIMVIFPVVSGDPPIANVGLLVFWTALSLAVWRIAGGKGWGLASDPDDAAERVATSGGTGIPEDWRAALEARGLLGTDVLRMVEHTYDPANSVGFVRPERRDVFRSLRLTPLHTVRVVIVGQDPYPSLGEADGLAFSVRAGLPIPHSLDRVFSNLSADPRVAFDRPQAGDLSRWAGRGVLLLNSALTFEHGGPSHRERWARFTSLILDAVDDSPKPVVFMLWGDDANSLADAARLDETRHKLIRSTHPRREEASSYPRFADTRPFSQANDFLRERGRGVVDWSLR